MASTDFGPGRRRTSTRSFETRQRLTPAEREAVALAVRRRIAVLEQLDAALADLAMVLDGLRDAGVTWRGLARASLRERGLAVSDFAIEREESRLQKFVNGRRKPIPLEVAAGPFASTADDTGMEQEDLMPSTKEKEKPRLVRRVTEEFVTETTVDGLGDAGDEHDDDNDNDDDENDDDDGPVASLRRQRGR